MSETFDPYHKWLGIPPAEQPPNHYRLLGISLFESDQDVIANAADARMAHVRTFQSGKRSAESQRILNEISSAKVCLLNPERKTEYDAGLRGDSQLPRAAASGPPRIPAPADPRPPVKAADPGPVIEPVHSTHPRSADSSTRLPSPSSRPGWLLWVAVGGVPVILVGIVLIPLLMDGGEPVAGPSPGENPPVEKPRERPPGKPPVLPPSKPPEKPAEKPAEKPPEKPSEKPPEKPKPPPEPLFGPVPEADALAEAETQLDDVSSDASPSLLLSEARAKDRTRAQRYVLLTRARQAAVQDGQVGTTLEILGEMKRRFEVDEENLQRESMTALADAVRAKAAAADSPDAARPVAENGLRLIEEAKALGMKDMLKGLSPTVLGAARASGDAGLIREATLALLDAQKGG